MLTVVTSATSFDLTTIATVRTELGITDQSNDVQLKCLIEHASGIISAHCKRVFALETVAETLRLDTLQKELILDRYPVVELALIVENGATLDPTEYEVDEARGIVTRLHSDRPCWWPIGKIVLTYSCGFALLGNLPLGVERACVQLVKAFYMGADRDPMVSSDATENLSSASYYRNVDHLPPDVRGLLAPHRNFRTR